MKTKQNMRDGRLILGYLDKIFGYWTDIRVLNKITGFWTKSLGFQKNVIQTFQAKGGNGLKIENSASSSCVKVPQEPECVLNFVFIVRKFLKKKLLAKIKILQEFFLKLQKTKKYIKCK